MSKNSAALVPNVSQLIIEKLQSYPPEVAQLALKAIHLSETLPEASVIEALQTEVRMLASHYGGGS